MIKTMGLRVSPQEVEDAVLATGLADEVVALGVADVLAGQVIHVAVRGSGDSDGLRRALLRDLPGHMVPRAIHWRSALPIGPNGKHDRAALYRELTDLAAQSAS
jgi:acyl-coenzyme A synthetase/AMP-(fatty) acid ligase